ncbi:hypothetical protein Ngar_c04070 [Candidatus Nitrososphaera gargensis Ga9.2]|uniref:Uncharacterized protein n=1 Tax=Nitrososphaera gargensis (strain Ga9.2) TaxID=1237085 RepID=K0ILU2_NITGG|nr:hypothetical protein Ngar_c04070 [Candidatus Nitrososphaera gargensis Ga9.2]
MFVGAEYIKVDEKEKRVNNSAKYYRAKIEKVDHNPFFRLYCFGFLCNDCGTLPKLNN